MVLGYTSLKKHSFGLIHDSHKGDYVDNLCGES